MNLKEKQKDIDETVKLLGEDMNRVWFGKKKRK